MLHRAQNTVESNVNVSQHYEPRQEKAIEEAGTFLKKQNTDTKRAKGHENPLEIHDTEHSSAIKINELTASLENENESEAYLQQNKLASSHIRKNEAGT